MRHKRVARGAPIVAPVLLVAVSLTAPAQGAISHNAGAVIRAVSARSSQRPLTPALAEQLSRNVTHKVIVVLREQFKGLPDTPANSARRAAIVRTTQHGVLSELAATHARNIKSISLVNAIAATVSPGEAKRLAQNPAVAEVTPDLPIPVLPSMPTIKPRKPAVGVTPLPGACPAKKTGVQLDPEAITNIHAASQSNVNTAQGLGYSGAGVKVAWIADGIDINNPDFIRANHQHVFVDYRDFSGTGTSANTSGGEAFLDASSIAAQGRHVYNIQNFGGAPLNRPCLIRILGVAPGASLVGLNVFGSSNFAFNSVFLEAIDWAVSHDHVNVLNESFGSNPFPDTASLDLTKQADAAAVKAGVTVVASSGDAGVTNTLGSPATDPLFISTGATTTFRAYAQSDAFGIFTGLPGLTGWLDNNISGISSSGFAQDASTVDVVAPGDLNWTLCTPTTQFAACTDFSNNPAPVQLSGGTSEAAPLTAGTAALVIQAYRKGHGGRSPSPAVVKKIIVSTAQDISAPAEQQGAGMVDAYQAVLAARSYPGSGRTQTPKGHAILESASQIKAIGSVSHAEHLSDTITNDGSSKVTVKLSSRTLSAPVTRAKGTLDLTSTQGFGAEVNFHVPRGQARLNVSGTLPNGGILIALVSPTGKFAGFNFPQGPSGYGNAQVANPAAGTWAAFVVGLPNDNTVTSIKAPFLATTSTFKSFGSLSKHSITLAPGASSSFSLNVSTPSKPSDEAGSIVLHAAASEPGFAAVTTVPVTLRSLVPVPAPTTTFTGTLTGGNGRAPSIGQTAYYQLRLPPGEHALNATVTTGNKNNTLFAVLVDPQGEAVSAAQNGLQTTNTSPLVLESGAQVHVVKPVPGVWTLIVDFYNSVSGTAANQPFTVKMNVTPVKASQNGLPRSVHIKLKSGAPVHASIKVTNSGSVPEEYFVDARLGGPQVTLPLAAQTTSSLTLPNLTGVVPTFLVPSLTTSLAAQVSAPQPNLFDLNWAFGDPDLASNIANTSTVTLTANDIPSGDWTVTPFLEGPDGATGPSPVTATVSMSAMTNALDPTITAPTGDLWDESTNPSATLTPVIVQPGHTVTIPVTITPSGSSGQVVSGTIYLSAVSFNPALLTINFLPSSSPTASTVASFPYTYTIK